MAKVYLACLLLGCSAFGQSLPNAPSSIWKRPLRDPAFYIGTGNFAASAIADVRSTKVCEANRTCVEAYKGHDSYGYIAPQIALVAGMIYGCSLMLSEHKHWRWACLAIPIALSIQHWKDASTIYHESPYARP